MIRAKVRRDGPGEWSWETMDDYGVLVTGVVDSWAEAIRQATFELGLFRAAAPVKAYLSGDARNEPRWRRWLGL